MNKWSVRLIGFFFFIWAISDFYKLITGTRHGQDFLGFDLGLAYNGKPIDVMGGCLYSHVRWLSTFTISIKRSLLGFVHTLDVHIYIGDFSPLGNPFVSHRLDIVHNGCN